MLTEKFKSKLLAIEMKFLISVKGISRHYRIRNDIVRTELMITVDKIN